MAASKVAHNCRKWLGKARRTVGAAGRSLVCDQNQRPLAEQLEPRLLLSGTIYVVNTLNDVVANDGHLSFREAILASNTNATVNEAAAGSGTEKDTITFSSSLFSGGAATLNLTAGSVQINDALAIQGTSSNKPTITGSGQVEILSGKSVDLSYLTLQENTLNHGALTLTNGVFDHALTLDGGSLSLVNSTITGGSITSSGSGGSVTAAGSTLNNSILNANLTVNNGSTLTVTNGLTLNSILSVGDGGASSNGTINFNGTQSLSGTGQIALAGTGGGSSSLKINGTSSAPATLIVASGITLHASNRYVYFQGAYGTLTNQGSIVVDSANTLLSSSLANLINDGSITASNGSDFSATNLKNDAGHTVSITGGGTLTLTSVQNSGTLSADNSTLTINGGWPNNGILTVTNSTVNLGGTFKPSDLGTFNRSGGMVNLTGTLDNSGATLLIDNLFSGSVTLAGGTLKGGTVSSSNPDYVLGGSGGTLDNVLLDTDMTCAVGTDLTVINGLTLNSTLSLSGGGGSSANLIFNGTQTLAGSGQVTFGGATVELDVNGTSSSTATLTIGSGITIHASFTHGYIRGNYGQIVSQGAILTDVAGSSLTIQKNNFTNDGLITASNGASLTASTLTNDTGHTVSVTGGGILTLTGVQNSGTISVDSSTLTLDGSWKNSGTISTANSAVNLDGTFKTADIGTFVSNGSTTKLVGSLDNSGATLLTDTAFGGPWTLDGSGTIKGGTLAASDPAFSMQARYGYLDNVTLNVDLNVLNYSYLHVTNGLTLNSTITFVNGDYVYAYTGIHFINGSQTISGTGEIIFGNNGTDNSDLEIIASDFSTLTIGSGITIRNYSKRGNIDGRSITLINQGTIITDSATATLAIGGSAASIVNDGSIFATNGSRLTVKNLANHCGHTVSVDGSTLTLFGTWSNKGSIASTNSTVNLGGTFKSSDLVTFNIQGSTLQLSGTLDNSGTTLLADNVFGDNFILDGGTIKGGTLTSSHPGYEMFTTGGALDNVILNNNLTTTDIGTLTITNGLVLNSTLSLGYFCKLDFFGTQTFSGTGRVNFTGKNTSLVVDGASGTTNILTIDSGITLGISNITSINSYSANSLVNKGNIQVSDTGSLTFSGLFSLVNQGSISSQPFATLNPSNLIGNTTNVHSYSLLGTTILNGRGTSANPQCIEVMSQDLGAEPNGFKQNFAYGNLWLRDDTFYHTYVKLVDQSDNAVGTGNEALYVNTLRVDSSTTLDLNGLHVYTRAAQIGANATVTGGTVTLIPDSGSLPLNTATPASLSVAGEMDEWTFYARKGHLLTVAVNTGSSGTSPALSPYLNYAQVTLVDSTGNVIATAGSTLSGKAVTLDSIDLPADGNYKVQVRAPQAQSSRSGNYTITALDVTPDVATILLNQQKTGAIESPYNSDQWTFAAVANQQISLKLLNSTTPGLVFDLTGPGNWQGLTGQVGSSGLITLPVTGTYTLTAHSTGGQYGGAYAFKLVETSQTTLSSGVAYNGTFAASGQAQLFKIDVSESSPLLLQLTDNGAGDKTEVYVKFGSAPTRADYDYRATDTTTGNQQLLIPMASSGSCYILVYANTIPKASNYSLLATAADVMLQGTTPDQSGTGTTTTLTLTGAGFVNGATVELVSGAGVHYAAQSTSIDSFTRMTATFGAGAVPAGAYSVLVTSGGTTAQLANALTMVQNGQANLVTNLIVPDALGRHATATIYVEYSNTGNAAMAAPMLILGSEDPDGSDKPLLTLDQSLLTHGFWTSAMPEGFSESVMILASGATPGILQPGETVKVPVYYAGLLQPWDMSDNQVELSLGVLGADNTTAIDWNGLKALMQPTTMSSEEWIPLWNNFVAQTGTTWGDYVTMLDENAAYLGRLGEKINDISQLLAFEFAQADGLGPMRTLTGSVDAAVAAPGMAITFSRFLTGSISLRNDTSTFGYGWDNNWDYSLTKAQDGTVTIAGPGGSTRTFQPDSRTNGAYFSELGDYGTLSLRQGGGYILRESDGSVAAFSLSGTLDYVEDTNANRITCDYTNGLLTSLTHSSGQYLHLSYTNGLLTGLVDQDGLTTTYNYEANSRLASVTDYTGDTITYAYSGHSLTSITYADGTHSYFTYDGEGRIASTSQDNDINKLTFTYDSAGTVTLTDGLGEVTKLYYDYRGLLVKATDPLGNMVSLSFDNKNNLTAITDAAGHSSSFAYDAKGNLLRSTDAMGHITSMTYAGAYNRLTSLTDANGNATLYGYDAKGNLTAITYANGQSEQWDYNTQGNPVGWVNCRGSEISYTYDSDGRILSKTYADGSQATYTYDAHGNLLTAADTDGTTSFTYNAKDQLTRVDYPGGQYLLFTYDAGGRRTSSVDQLGHATNYQYDAVGRLSRVIDETGALLTAYTYDAVGRLARKDMGNGVYTTYGYDAAGQLLHLINYNPDNTVLSRFDYTYDSRDRRTSMTTKDGVWTYEYDDIGELTHALFASNDPGTIPNQDLQYIYDAMGNRIKTIENGVTTDYTVNSMNQYTRVGDTTYVFDADGNLIQEISPSGTTTYTYNSENKLTAISSPQGTWAYSYDALGNRATANNNDTLIKYVIDPAGLGNIVGVYNGSNSLVTRNAYGYGLLTSTSGTTTTYYYTFDALGSVSELTNAAGAVVNSYSYTPFGAILKKAEAIANPFQFVGELGVMQDPSGLIYMRARQYDATTGRFTTLDPINILGGINLYEYVRNSFLYYVDPTGLAQCGKEPFKGNKISNNGIIDRLNLQVAHEECFLTGGEKSIGYGPKGVSFALGPKDRIKNYELSPQIYDDDLMIEAAINLKKSGKWMDDSWKWGRSGYWIIGHNCQDFADTLREEYYRLKKEQWINSGFSEKEYEVLNKKIDIAKAIDPNDLIGPSGYGSQGYISTANTFAYRIDFENDKTATAPAQQVVITNSLNSNFDWSSFQLTEIGFGDTLISVPEKSSHFETTVAMAYSGKTFNVQIEAGIDFATGMITAVFQSLDPNTELPPDVLTGFLPPEDGTGRGMGYIAYLVDPKADLATGTEIKNIALISFDGQLQIATNQVDPHDPSKGTDPTKEALNTIDVSPPTSSVTALPASSTASFQVSWSGSDAGSGIASYNVYVSTNGGDYTLWKEGLTDTSAMYAGQAGHTYGFYSIARDNVGLAEQKAPVAEASIRVKEPTSRMLVSCLLVNPLKTGANLMRQVPSLLKSLGYQPAEPLVASLAMASEASASAAVSPMTFATDNSLNLLQSATVNVDSEVDQQDTAAVQTLAQGTLQRLISTSQKPTGTVVGITAARNSDLIESNLLASEQPESSLSLTSMDTAAYLENSIQAESIPVIGNTWNSQTNQGAESSAWLFLTEESAAVHEGWDTAALNLVQHQSSPIVEPLAVSQELLDEWSVPFVRRAA